MRAEYRHGRPSFVTRHSRSVFQSTTVEPHDGGPGFARIDSLSCSAGGGKHLLHLSTTHRRRGPGVGQSSQLVRSTLEDKSIGDSIQNPTWSRRVCGIGRYTRFASFAEAKFRLRGTRFKFHTHIRTRHTTCVHRLPRAAHPRRRSRRSWTNTEPSALGPRHVENRLQLASGGWLRT